MNKPVGTRDDQRRIAAESVMGVTGLHVLLRVIAEHPAKVILPSFDDDGFLSLRAILVRRTETRGPLCLIGKVLADYL